VPDDELYRQHILDHFEQPYHRGSCPSATHAHEDTNPLCGDMVRVTLRVNPQGCAECLCFDGEGCCISQAAASMMAEHLEGKSFDELRRFSAQEMLALFGARLTATRQRCCLLALRVLHAACASSAS
jgi:nitrogen fixation NifU-like protein